MSDEHPTLPLPSDDAPGPADLRWVLASERSAEPRRRRWPWLVGLLVVAVLIVVAAIAGESIARGILERTVRDQIVTNLSLPADQQIDVEVPGLVLPQLIVGSLGEVRIASDDVPLHTTQGEARITADVVVDAQDVPIRGGDWSGASAHITFDETQLNALLANVDGFPVDTVTLDPPSIGVSMDLSLWLTTVAVGVDLTPRAENGELVLTPEKLRVGGAEISAEALAAQFGAVASTVIRDWDVCVAQYYPSALTLTGVRVDRTGLVADLDIDGSILSDRAAREPGTCD